MRSYKIGFVGLPSTGKTTSAKYLYQLVEESGITVSLVNEVAREAIQDGFPITCMDVQYGITKTQIERELHPSNCKEIIICESPIFMGLAYANQYFLNTNEDYKLYNTLKGLTERHHYDMIFYCNTLGKYEEDGVRYQKREEMGKLEYYIRKMMNKYHKGDIITLPRGRDARIEVLSNFVKNLGEYKNDRI